MVKRIAFLIVLSLGCGAKAPAQSAAPAETQSPKVETGPEPALAAASKPQGPTAPSVPASPEDIRGVLQAVIDDEALEPYLKLQLPNRFPLRISGPNLPKDLQLVKSTKPVVIVNGVNPDPKKPVLVFTEIEIKGTDATVSYRYDVEGVRGAATLNKPYGRWSLKQSRVAEH
jgi:hypothetical protein